ncbi:MAG: hypothetical protein EXS50_01455 [Candidatus Taylorbacteria bacterium]|nr:hypothetical protein [Candidatus Taylorbacteria bacterium]
MKKILFYVSTAIILIFIFFAFNLSRKNISEVKINSQSQFLIEVFDLIKKDYWNKIEDDKLASIFTLATQKALATTTLPTPKSRDELLIFFDKELSDVKPESKKDTTASIANLVLVNLEPFGRSRLFTTSQEKSLRNEVSNINQSRDLYSSLELSKDASKDQIEKKYTSLVAAINKEKPVDAAKKIKELAYAKGVLTNKREKDLYDLTKIEPTLFIKALSPTTYYMNLTKFSPTSIDEFTNAASTLEEKNNLSYLIIDMRSNLGGSLDIVPYLSGFFIGSGQYAFDLWKQGIFTPFKTLTQKLPEISQFKKVLILVDGNTQSSAELFSSVLKKYNRAIIVGTKTKGWGTVENTFPIETTLDGDHYSIFLVHSLTLRDDNMPIEQNGVLPDVDISKKNWRQTASIIIGNSDLLTSLDKALDNRP